MSAKPQSRAVPKPERLVATGRVRFLPDARVYVVTGRKRVHPVIVDGEHRYCVTCACCDCDHADAVAESRRPRQRRRARALRLL